MKNLISMALLLFAMGATAQKVYVEEYKYMADYIVYETDRKSEANWVVMFTEWDNDAKDGKWKFVEWKTSADFTIFFTDRKSEADRVIYLTEWSTDLKFKR